MDEELKKLSRIVEGLFTLAMADAGPLRLAREPLYLNEVLEESCALATPLAQAKGIHIDQKLNEDFINSANRYTLVVFPSIHLTSVRNQTQFSLRDNREARRWETGLDVQG